MKKIKTIYWTDAATVSGWQSLSNACEFKPVKCVTMGIEIKRTKKYILVAASYSLNDKGDIVSVADVTSILLSSITKIKINK